MSSAARRRAGSSGGLAGPGLVALVLGASLVGCGASPSAAPEAAPAAASSGAAATGLAAGTTTTLTDPDPAARAAALATALFASAPVVVVADVASQAAAGPEAVRLGVPLLLAGDPLAGALTKLGTRRAVVYGQVALPGGVEALAAPGSSSVPAASGPATTTSTPPASPAAGPVPSDLASAAVGKGETVGGTAVTPATAQPQVLVLAAPGDTASYAATATARAAGATVVLADDVRSPDVRKAVAGRGSDPLLVLGGSLDQAAARYLLQQAAAPGLVNGTALVQEHRYVGLYGLPDAPSLGALGEQGPAETVQRDVALAASYDGLSTPAAAPMFDLITTGAAGTATSDGSFSTKYPVERLTPLLDAAHAAGIYTVLDLQPGMSTLVDQAKLYETLLQRPDVGLALDPEWKLQPGDRPLQQVGHVQVDEINQVVTYLADLTRSKNLPQKLLLVHQFQLAEIRGRDMLDTSRPELALEIQMDGQGGQAVKNNTYAAVTKDPPGNVVFGWKNFYDEDSPTLTPAETMKLQPTPWFVSYQ